MRLTILYDNDVWEEGLRADWGFSCLVEAYGRRILFDTGASGQILLHNMERLGIDPTLIDEVFISHGHGDHTGGLSCLLDVHPVKVYIPSSCPRPHGAGEVVWVKGPLRIHEDIFSTGELGHMEQSLAIKTERGVVVVVGCSHPGVREILNAASRFGEVRAVVGGLHGFRDLSLVRDLECICPTHCTVFKLPIRLLYPDKYVRGGAGRIIEI